MTKPLVSLLAVLSLLMVGGVADVSAAQRKTLTLKAAGSYKQVSAHRHRHRRATIADAKVLALASAAALVQDESSGSVLFEKNGNTVVPIA